MAARRRSRAYCDGTDCRGLDRRRPTFSHQLPGGGRSSGGDAGRARVRGPALDADSGARKLAISADQLRLRRYPTDWRQRMAHLREASASRPKQVDQSIRSQTRWKIRRHYHDQADRLRDSTDPCRWRRSKGQERTEDRFRDRDQIKAPMHVPGAEIVARGAGSEPTSKSFADGRAGVACSRESRPLPPQNTSVIAQQL